MVLPDALFLILEFLSLFDSLFVLGFLEVAEPDLVRVAQRFPGLLVSCLLLVEMLLPELGLLSVIFFPEGYPVMLLLSPDPPMLSLLVVLELAPVPAMLPFHRLSFGVPFLPESLLAPLTFGVVLAVALATGAASELAKLVVVGVAAGSFEQRPAVADGRQCFDEFSLHG